MDDKSETDASKLYDMDSEGPSKQGNSVDDTRGTEDNRIATERPISQIKVGKRYRKDLGDLTDIEESIQQVGLLHPIVVTPDYSLIAGQRRLEACRRLGWEVVPVRIIDLKDAVMAEHDENVVRKPFLPSEAVAIKRAIEPELKEQAKQRQREAGRIGGATSGRGRKKQQGGEQFSPPYSQKTRDAVGTITGMSHPSMRKAEAIVKAAEDDPDKFEHLVKEMDNTGKVDPVYRKLTKLQRTQSEEPSEAKISGVDGDSARGRSPVQKDLPTPSQESSITSVPLLTKASSLPSFEFCKSQMVPFMGESFDVILVNAPWERLGKGGYPYPSAGAVQNHAPVHVLSSDDCIVWLRATNSHMDEAFRCLSGWGIRPRSILTWVKPEAIEGEWLHDQTEHYIVAVYGNPPLRDDHPFSTVVFGPPMKDFHKPEGFYQLIEHRCLSQSRLEVFCEGPQEGWEAWTPDGLIEWFHEAHPEAFAEDETSKPRKRGGRTRKKKVK